MAEVPARGASTSSTPSATGLSKRAVTVTDSIQMTRLGNPDYTDGAPSKGIVAKFSPDKKYFVVVLKKGNLETNTNEYSLVLFHTANVFESPQPHVLTTMASSSNRPAIKNVVWLGDNDTILFLGEHPGEQTALYSVKCSSSELKKLTNHVTSLTSFAATASGEDVAYTAKNPTSTFASESVSRNGFVVTHEWVTDLIRGSHGGEDFDADALFLKRTGEDSETKITLQGRIVGVDPEILFSPDGTNLLLKTEAKHISKTWSEYEEPFLHLFASSAGPEGSATNIYQYEMVDTRRSTGQVLFDAPLSMFGSEAAWSPDGKSVVVSDAYLPLDVDDPAERALRRAHTFLVEFNIPSRQLIKISNEDLRLNSWDPRTGEIACDVGRNDSLNGKTTAKTYFQKSGEAWSKASPPETTATRPEPEIVLEEDLNSPPRIVAIEPSTGQRSLLIDLNPQFRNLALARVEEVTWKDAHGIAVKGGLYWPPDYVAGKKYPLILQTHGWNPDRFWMDGPWPTAFAAQPLAGKGFFVLQVPDPDWHVIQTPQEAQRAMAAYESAIDYLDRRGLIDRNGIGVTGFSRTYWYITYMLTHSKRHFAAVDLADGVDYGYFQYMVLSNADPAAAGEYEQVYGGPPFGKGLSRWLKRSPSFLMDKIETPLRIQALGPASVLEDWHWFSGLSRLGKPVEMIYIPDAPHVLEKPWDRMISQQGNVDWFCFWIKSEEDPDPTKAEQYSRWHELRRKQGRVASSTR